MIQHEHEMIHSSRHKTLSTTRNAVGPAAKLERSVKLGLN